MDALFAPDAERAFVGSILRSPAAARVLSDVSPDDFADVAAKRAVTAANALRSAGKPLEVTLLGCEVERLYGANMAVLPVLVEMFKCVPNGGGAAHYAEIVKDAARRRRLADLADVIAKAAHDPTEDVTATIEAARDKVREMSAARGGWRSAVDVTMDAYEHIEAMSKGEVHAIPTGVRTLDVLTGGLFRGEMTILGARPAAGKTALGLQFAIAAADDGNRVCFVSEEMSAVQMGNRMLARDSGLNGGKLRSGRDISEDDWNALSSALGMAAERQIAFLHGSQSVEEIRQEVSAKVDADECDLLIVDYLQLIRTKERCNAEYERIGHVSRAFKLMSLDLNIPVVVLAQLRRPDKDRRAGCPTMDELRGSGDIEQDADNIILIHKPQDERDSSLPAEDKETFNAFRRRGLDYTIFNVCKLRQGRTGMAAAAFDSAHMRFLEIDRG